jgi:tungstate transport system ATP-binding protein
MSKSMSARILPLQLDDIRFAANGREIIPRLSHRFEAGLLTMIIGPNGAGKSLLLRICHGLVVPHSGSVQWQGPQGDNPQRHQAMVFQKPVMMRRSVLANVEYPLKLRGVGAAERRTRAMGALERTGLAGLAETPATVLSGGEAQKLALARAWVMEPDVLFLDEPTASLDPAGTREVENLIRAIHQAGTKIIMTSHRADQVRRLGDEVVFIHAGRILEVTATKQFLKRAKSPQARAYLVGDLLVEP